MILSCVHGVFCINMTVANIAHMHVEKEQQEKSTVHLKKTIEMTIHGKCENLYSIYGT